MPSPHISTEQALQIPQQLSQQLRRQGSHGGSGSSPLPNSNELKPNPNYLSDDAVTLLHQEASQPVKKLQVGNYKSELAQDNAIIRETLRNKLSEYKLNPRTQLSVSKDLFGNIELKGALLQSDLERITKDLNASKAFKGAFNNLSRHQPTLNYVDNVAKLASAYGVGNALFNSLVSDDGEFNKLNDLSHRYQALRANVANVADISNGGGIEQNFQFVLNA